MSVFAQLSLALIASLSFTACGGQGGDSAGTSRTFLKHVGGVSEDTWAIIGSFTEFATFGLNGPMPVALTSLGGFDVFVGRLNAEGDL